MTKKTLLSTALGLVLVLCLAGAGQASTWTGDGTWYPKGSTWTGTADISSSGSYTVSFDIVAQGTWDALGNPYTKPTTLDTLSLQVYKGTTLVATYSFQNIDIAGKATDVPLPTKDVHLETLVNLADAGTYTFKLVTNVTASDESWQFTSGNVNPTPLPAAVWLLGSGVVGLVGLRRARKNAA